MSSAQPVIQVDVNGVPVSSSGGASTNLVSVGGANIVLGQTTSSGSLPVTIASDQSLAITGSVVASGAISGTGTAGTAATGVLTVQGIASMTKLLVTPDAGATVQPIPATSGGTTLYHAAVPNNVTGVVVKNTPGQVYGIQLSNNSTTIGYLHLYDSTSAPTAGAGTILKTLIVPGPSGGGGGGNNYVNVMGAVFASGIAYTFTAGNGTDTDNTAPAVSTYTINFDYK